MKQTQKAFTLVELMIVVALVGILASIAYPSYTEQVTKTRRTEAQSALQQLAMAQERQYTLNGRYASTPAELKTLTGLTELTWSDADGGFRTANAYYLAALAAGATATAYTLQATPVAGNPQANDSYCTRMTLSSLGIKGGEPSGNRCWP